MVDPLNILTGDYTLRSVRPCDLSSCTKEDILKYFENSYSINESLFTTLASKEAFFMCGDRLRLPLIFYYAHTAVVYSNKMLLAGLVPGRMNVEFETMFETGVDEQSWDDTENYRMGGEFQWPPLEEVVEYRCQVRNTIRKVIANTPLELPVTMDSPWWALFMGFEHERIHIDTSSVLIQQLPIHLVRKPVGWRQGPLTHGEGVKNNKMVTVPACEVTLGKPWDFPSYGWDNEYPQCQIKVPAFEASEYLITNKEFLEFVKSGCYEKQQYWTTEGWQWRNFQKVKHPIFWICNKGCLSNCGGVLTGYSHCCKPESCGMTNYSTNGHTNGDSHGHTDGDGPADGDGHANGDTHGHPNGDTHGHPNGDTHGHANGDSHGHANGDSHGHGNGDSHGHANGDSHGHANGDNHGHANGDNHGHANGDNHGHANGDNHGHANGDNHGHANGDNHGHDNGHGDGHADGDGHANGDGHAHGGSHGHANGDSHGHANGDSHRHTYGSDFTRNSSGNRYRLRILCKEIPMPWDWPVAVNFHEAKAYCKWNGPEYRLMTEAEHNAIRDDQVPASYGTAADVLYNDDLCKRYNTNLAYCTNTPVNLYPPSEHGFYDVFGNMWQWMEDHFNGLPNTQTHYLYDDFSTPTFDGKHNVILGGCWMSTGDESSRFARYAFRRHFYQHAGFRLVRSLDIKTTLPVALVSNVDGVIEDFSLPVGTRTDPPVPSTNTQLSHESGNYLASKLQEEYSRLDRNLPIQLAEICYQALVERGSKLDTGLDVQCGCGKLSFHMTTFMKKVFGMDYCSSFLQAAESVQNDFCYKATLPSGEILTAELPQGTDQSRVQFKQFTWIPNEILNFDLAVLQGVDRVINKKAWLLRLWEIIVPNGVVVIVSTRGYGADELIPDLKNHLELADVREVLYANSVGSIATATVTIWHRK